jgi:uncharacterized protein
METRFDVQVAHKGIAEGEALVCRQAFIFYDINPENGVIEVAGHALEGRSVKEKILVCPCGCGASTEDWFMYTLAVAGMVPKGIINGRRIFYINVAGAILADIPMVYGLDQNCLNFIHDGDHIAIDANKGIVKVVKKESV